MMDSASRIRHKVGRSWEVFHLSVNLLQCIQVSPLVAGMLHLA
jgi:hypothetical protein